ncbi:ESX secretion-associated protein EspG [Tsukamurella soli]|uniref:ESX secretion-associated protein EspG n=1 Tax=Tsukamurella soli TaxID=644556 RepID=UPI0031EC76D8
MRLEARVADPLGTRLVLARRGDQVARAVRRGAIVTVDRPHCDGTGARLAALIEPALPRVWCADHCAPASFPSDDGVELLAVAAARGRSDGSARAPDHSRVAAGLRALGVPAPAAAQVGRVLAHADCATEMTLAAGDRLLRSTVVVIDSPSGRVVATTVPAADGRLWTSIAEGSAHRIGQGLQRACEELPAGAWLP